MAGVSAFIAKSPGIAQRHQSERFRWRALMLERMWMPFSLGTGTPRFALSRSGNARDPTSLVGILPKSGCRRFSCCGSSVPLTSRIKAVL